MEMMSLATLTRVDEKYPVGHIRRKAGKLIFHSEAERLDWLDDIEDFLMSQGVTVTPMKSTESDY